MTDQRRPDLDQAIDAAVGEYMDVDASGTLSRNVLSRLERPEARGGWWRPAVGAAAVATATLAGLLITSGGGSPDRREPGRPVKQERTVVAAEPSAAPLAPSATDRRLGLGAVPRMGPDSSAPPPALPEDVRVRRSAKPDEMFEREGSPQGTLDAAALPPVTLGAAPAPHGTLEAAAPRSVDVEPLTLPEPIALAPLDTPMVKAEEIVVPPLAPLAAVHVEPLGSSGRRN